MFCWNLSRIRVQKVRSDYSWQFKRNQNSMKRMEVSTETLSSEQWKYGEMKILFERNQKSSQQESRDHSVVILNVRTENKRSSSSRKDDGAVEESGESLVVSVLPWQHCGTGENDVLPGTSLAPFVLICRHCWIFHKFLQSWRRDHHRSLWLHV